MNRIKAQRDTTDGAHLGSKPENPIHIGRKNEDGKPVINLEKEAFYVVVNEFDSFPTKVVKLSTAQDREEELKREIAELRNLLTPSKNLCALIRKKYEWEYSPLVSKKGQENLDEIIMKEIEFIEQKLK